LLVHIGDPSSNQATTLESQMIHMIQELSGQTLRPKRSEQVLQVNSLKIQYSLTETTESARMAALLDFNGEKQLAQTNTERIEEKDPGLV
jgi:hypothetical protein